MAQSVFVVSYRLTSDSVIVIKVLYIVHAQVFLNFV